MINGDMINDDMINGDIINNDMVTDDFEIPELSLQEELLNDSRITPTGNGSPVNKQNSTQPTSGQKWWAAVILGFVFALLSSPTAYHITSQASVAIGGSTLIEGNGPYLSGLLIQTIIFIIIVRLILW